MSFIKHLYYRTLSAVMNSLLCIVFTSVLLSQVTCNTLARIKLLKEAGNNQVHSSTNVCTNVANYVVQCMAC